ncbi:unnamed protein product, partial [Musa acuminata subsp. burmannicoides]
RDCASTAIAVSSTTPGDRPLHQSHPGSNGGKFVLLPHERKGEQEKTFGGLFFVHSILVGALEDVIEGHSCGHSHYIRKACEANIGGCSIGSLANNAILSEKIQEHSCPIDSSQH